MVTLKNRRDFKRVIDCGRRKKLENIIAYRLPNQLGITRLGISTTKRTGGSVDRNRVKRRVREAVRKNASFLPPGEDIVIVAGRKCLEAPFEEIERDVRGIGESEEPRGRGQKGRHQRREAGD